MSTRTIFRSIAVLAALIAVASCAGKKSDPLEDAIVAKLQEQNPTLERFEITRLESESSVTLGSELARRESIFRTKAKDAGKKAAMYREKNMMVNAKKNGNIQKEAQETLDRFATYRENHAAQLDSVVYNIFRMDGFGRTTDKARIEVKDYYVSVSPSGEVLAIVAPDANPHKNMGRVIPGYFTEILGEEEETE